ncbi:GtrA family protein [Haloarcula sp. CGMCC 1.2071]|uniref:GtrA family protein n=1 Tax=Haloarcula sp. CGMCC 1.2071 TaxID=3111454 RepID=UPI00300F4A54
MTTKSRLDALVHRGRIGRFISVGLIGATIETAIVGILTVFFGIGPIVAKAFGAETSISTMFAVNDRWTFAEKGEIGPVAFIRRWVKSHMVRLVGLLIAFLVLYLLTNVIEFSVSVATLDLWPSIANIIGIGVGMVLNYVAESLFTWDITEAVGDV